jgi:hypothetical protein
MSSMTHQIPVSPLLTPLLNRHSPSFQVFPISKYFLWYYYAFDFHNHCCLRSLSLFGLVLMCFRKVFHQFKTSKPNEIETAPRNLQFSWSFLEWAD